MEHLEHAKEAFALNTAETNQLKVDFKKMMSIILEIVHENAITTSNKLTDEEFQPVSVLFPAPRSTETIEKLYQEGIITPHTRNTMFAVATGIDNANLLEESKERQQLKQRMQDIQYAQAQGFTREESFALVLGTGTRSTGNSTGPTNSSGIPMPHKEPNKAFQNKHEPQDPKDPKDLKNSPTPKL